MRGVRCRLSLQKGGKTSVEEGLRWADGVPPRGSQVRVAGAREDLWVEFC